MILSLEECNRKCAEAMGYKLVSKQYLQLPFPIDEWQDDNGQKKQEHFYFSHSMEDSELLLKHIEEQGLDYDESFKSCIPRYEFGIHEAGEMIGYSENSNKLINRMIAFLSWQLKENVELKD